MSEYVFTTEASCDLPEEYFKNESLIKVPLYYSFDDKEIYGEEQDLPICEFYANMRNGNFPKTMASNLDTILTIFRTQLDHGKDIIHIAFSCALSSSCNNAILASKILSEEYPERKIHVVDSLLASLGQGLLVDFALTKQSEGLSYEEMVCLLEEYRYRICADFTVDNLATLRNGGRISKTTALLGNVMNIKPVLHMDREGHLVSLHNLRGRKKALLDLVDNMTANMDSAYNRVFISHGDCIEDAEYIGRLITEKFGINDITYNFIGPAIGSHSGPGTVALFYFGNKDF